MQEETVWNYKPEIQEEGNMLKTSSEILEGFALDTLNIVMSQLKKRKYVQLPHKCYY
jgi:hypothetical protein